MTRVGADCGPNLDKGFDMINSAVRRFSVGAPFRVQAAALKIGAQKDSKSALSLNADAVSFVPRPLLMAFDTHPYIFLDFSQASTLAGGWAWQQLLDALPEGWQSHEAYHNKVYETLQNYSASEQTAFEKLEVRDYNLIEELQVILPIVRQECAAWNGRRQRQSVNIAKRIAHYVDAFQTLLSVEQLCHEKDTHKFDLHCSSQPRILSDGHIRISVPWE